MIGALLEQQPLLTLFLVIGLGYAAGAARLGGFSLGVGAVLFVGLAIGWLAPKAAPPAPVGTIGLVLFLYGIGTQYGREFLAGLTSARGRRANLTALGGLMAGVVVVLVAIEALRLPVAATLGMFAGAMTSTAALQAALDATGSRDPAVGYAVTYPFGVIGPILCLYLAQAVLRPKLPAEPERLEMVEVTLGDAGSGALLGELLATLPPGVEVAAVRQAHHNRLPDPGLTVQAGDGLLLVGADHAVLAQAMAALGAADPGRLARDRGDLDYLRVFASAARVIGRPLSGLRPTDGAPFRIIHVRRGDPDLMPRPDLVLEHGDRVGLLAPRASFAGLRGWFGDSIRGTAELSYVAVGIGLALGMLVGAIAVPLPGLAPLALGAAGGPLVTALVLGRIGWTRGLCWRMPLSANLVLRNFGLTLFLAAVGISSGAPFVATLRDTGASWLLLGAVILLATVAVTLALGLFVTGLAWDELLGVVAGVTGNPAILAFAARQVPSDRPDIGYAIIFPAATILKIVLVQLLAAVYATPP